MGRHLRSPDRRPAQPLGLRPDAGPPRLVNALAFSPDGGTLAVADDGGTLQLWDTASQQPLGSGLTTPGEAIASLAFTPNGATLEATGRHAPVQR
ncbi:WD40 repeat domain-containing protein [Streptomyces sp. NPDC050121]|uniref:WD40 repeat domain-containing protein n=1 Tax=Streptomyces sp. NPDC050121 TaxID=3365601 RepID=UPI0037A887F1